MALFKKIDFFVDQHRLFKADGTYIVGLSGGADSAFLLHYLVYRTTLSHQKMRLIAVHLDHEWRANSHHDVQVAHAVAASLGVLFVSKKASELGIECKNNGSKEALGRLLRRAFFSSMRAEYAADGIVLGHHGDDQVENFFIRLIRGAGLEGLSGMRFLHQGYIRPLLAVTKDEIVAYMLQSDLRYCTDESNSSDEFLRNRVRNELVPLLHSVDKRFYANATRTMHNIAQAQEYIDLHTQSLYQNIRVFDQELGWGLCKERFLRQHLFMQHQLLLHWLIKEHRCAFFLSEAFFAQIKKFFVHNKADSHRLCPNFTLVKKQNAVYVKKH